MLFKVEKELKGSRRYKAADENFPIQTVYVSRPFAEGKEKLEIQIKEFSEEASG